MQLKEKLGEAWEWAGHFLKNRLMLAPMAGFTASPFREIAADFGAAWLVTELCSARGIVYDPAFARNARYLDLGERPEITAIQLFGSEAEDFTKAIPLLLQHKEYGRCAAIDINMGCPVAKVVKTGAGSALMRDPERAARVLEAAVRAAAPFGKAVTVKFRSGWDAAHINAPDFASRMEAAGAAGLCLHARTREQFYSGEADHGVTRACLEEIHIPLAANGDLRDLASCEKILAMGASACMIGRAAQGNPWLFSELLNEAEGEAALPLSAETWLRTIERELDGLRKKIGQPRAVREFRPILSAYLKGKAGAAALRRELMEIEEPEELLERVREAAAGMF